MKKIISLIFIFILVMPLILADGMIIDPQGYLPENQQLAAINYENGLEKLILSIQTDELRDEKTAWIFPVPGDPSKVVIDVVPEFPSFYGGANILQQAESALSSLINYLNYPFIAPLIFRMFSSRMSTKSFDEAAQLGEIKVSGGDVTVYEHIEKYGVTTEVIGAKTGLNIYVYLKNKGLEPKFSIAGVLNDYIGKDYTFVVSWINKQQPTLDEVTISEGRVSPSRIMPYRRLGVMVMFPTDKIFYPLIPTSVYGSKEIPTTLYVLDYAKPELYNDLKSFVKTTYYKKTPTFYSEQELNSFFGEINKQNFKYTRIDINAPSKYFTQDLYITPGAPTKVYYGSFINEFVNNKLIFFILVAILSALVSSLLGLILFKKPAKFALVGLANLLTIIALIITLIFVKTKKPNTELQRKLKEEGFLVIGDGIKKFIFIISFILLYIISTYLLIFLLKLPL